LEIFSFDLTAKPSEDFSPNEDDRNAGGRDSLLMKISIRWFVATFLALGRPTFARRDGYASNWWPVCRPNR
jgi:hypothetical protein